MFLTFALGLVLLVKLAHKPVGREDADGSQLPAGLNEVDKRPRAFSEIPRQQRRRLVIVLVCAALVFLIVAPMIAVGTASGQSLWRAAPLLVLLAMMVLGVAVV